MCRPHFVGSLLVSPSRPRRSPARPHSHPPPPNTPTRSSSGLPATAAIEAGVAAGDVSARPPPSKRPCVAFDVPPPGLVVTVRDVEAKHKSVRIVVPDSWDLLLKRLRERCGYEDSHRLYYSTIELVSKKMKLTSEADFATYATNMAVAGHLPDIWMLRAAAAEVPSPPQLPVIGEVGISVASSRSSAQQSNFRDALFFRDGSDAVCALCGSDSDLQAAHILPRACHDVFTTEEGLFDAMIAAGLVSRFDVRNGFLLCDQCHDFFDAYLWSVDSERNVVVSAALMAFAPATAGYAGKQLFPDEGTATPLVAFNRPLPGLWAWHYATYGRARRARHAEARDRLHFCGKCNKPYVRPSSQMTHEDTCTAV